MIRRRETAGCPDLERLKTWLDGELPPGESGALGAHVETCPTCGAEVLAMRKIGEGLSELAGAVEPPAGMRERLLARLPAGEARPRFTLPSWGQALAASGLGILVIAMVMPVFSRHREAARSSSPASAEIAAAPASEPPGAGGTADPMRMRAAAAAAQQSYGGTGVSAADIETYVRGAEGEVVDRKVIQTADLTVQVKQSLEEAEKAVTRHVVGAGGYLESSEVRTAEDGERRAELALRVPVERFEGTVSWLVDLGTVKAKQVRGEDVTGRFIDQRALVRELRAEEAVLAARMKSAKKAAERDAARWELVRLRSRIRAAEERLAVTAKMAALSSIRLRLIQPRSGPTGAGLLDDAGGFFRYAAEAFLWALRIPLAIGIWVVVFAPLWVPALLAYRRIGRRA